MSAFEGRFAAALRARADEVDDRVDAAAVAARVARLPRARWRWQPEATPGIHGGFSRRALVLAVVLALLAVGLVLVGGPLLVPSEEPVVTTPTIVDVVAANAADEVALIATADGAVWRLGIGRLTRFDPEKGTAESWDVATDPLVQAEAATAARDGGVWLASRTGIVRFAAGAVVDRVPAPEGVQVYLLAEANDGTLWADSGDALFRRDPLGWTRIEHARPGTWPLDLALDGRGQAWGVMYDDATNATELQRLDTSGWTSFGPSDAPELGRRPCSVATTAGSGVLVGSSGGVARYEGGTWTSLGAPSPTIVGGPNCWSAVEGADGHVWAALESTGAPVVARLDPAGWRTYSSAEGLPGAFEPSSMRLVSTAGQVVVSVAGTAYRYSGDAWQPLTGAAAGLDALRLRLAPVSRDEAWGIEWGDRGTDAAPTGLWHFVAGEARLVPGSEPTRAWGDIGLLPEGPVVASPAGVSVWTGDSWRVIDERPAERLTVAPDGRIWVLGPVGTPARALERNGAGWVTTELAESPFVGRIVVDARGDAWVVGGESWITSLARWHAGAWETVSVVPGSEGSFGNVAVAPNGDVWVTIGGLGTNSVCCEFDPQRQVGRFDGLSWTLYGVGDGLPAGNLGARVAVTADGRVWVAGDSLSEFDGQRWTSSLTGYRLGEITATPDGGLWAAGPMGALQVALPEP